MKAYQEILKGYRKRQRDTVVDAIATGLTFMDELVVDSGLLEETGLMAELTGSVCGALPFAIIAVQEGTKVILGLKPAGNGMQDGAFRMVKTGAALGVGGVVAASAGFWAAIPVTMGVRALFDRYKSKAMTGMRVQNRITRLQELNSQLRQAQEEFSTEEDHVVLEEPEMVAVIPS
ncbi:MAG: hypothetical protein IJZ74_02075 [Clostridia bacterium]|nr:hypothetical protein [Clostridia bacterium]